MSWDDMNAAAVRSTCDVCGKAYDFTRVRATCIRCLGWAYRCGWVAGWYAVVVRPGLWWRHWEIAS